MEEIVAKLKVDSSGLGGAPGNARNAVPVFITNQTATRQGTKERHKHSKDTAFAVTAGLATWEGIKKGMDFLVKASPLLQGTLRIFGQSLKLLVKPVGDMIAMVLRPFALAMLRFAIPFYQMSMKRLQSTGGKVGGVIGGIAGGAAGGVTAGAIGGALAGSKALGGLLGALGTAIAGPIGTTIGVAIGAVVGALLGIFFGDELQKWSKAAWDFFAGIQWGDLLAGFVGFFTETIPAIRETLNTYIGTFFLETLPFAAGFAFQTILNFFTDTLPNATVSVFKSITMFFTQTLPNAATGAFKTIGNFVLNIPVLAVAGFNTIRDFFLVTIPSWFTSMFDSIVNAWERVKSAFGLGGSSARSNNSNYNSYTKAEDVGGGMMQDFYSQFENGNLVSKTPLGIAGPQSDKFRNRVQDAIISPDGNIITTDPKDYLIATKDPQSLMGGGNPTFAPNITVQATINSDIDIQRLAERLAEYQKNELTRRTNDFRF